MAMGADSVATEMSDTRRLVEVTVPIEGKVGTRQDAFFPLAHVPNRDVRRDAGADQPMEEPASAVRCVSGEPFGLEPQSLVRPFDPSSLSQRPRHKYGPAWPPRRR
jgi:hypothetical protein